MFRSVWSDKYLLGIKKFDQDHERLFDLMNSAHALLDNSTPHAKLETILDELIEYASYHFNSEEEWMEEHSYPKLPEHKAEHEI